MPLSVRGVHSSVASCSIISGCIHCINLTVLHCNTLTLCVHMSRGQCMHTHKYFVCLDTVNSYGHTIIVAYVCVVCSYLTRKGNADIQHSLMFKTKLVLLLKCNTSCHQPFIVTPPTFFPLLAVTHPLLYKSFSYLYLICHKSFNFGFILMFVLNQTAMHASSVYCMECLKYLLTESYFI